MTPSIRIGGEDGVKCKNYKNDKYYCAMYSIWNADTPFLCNPKGEWGEIAYYVKIIKKNRYQCLVYILHTWFEFL